MSPRSCTSSSRHITAASTRCVAIISFRFGSRSTTSPPNGAARLTSANTKKTSPASLEEPVSAFTQIARTMIIAQSPNIESVCPASRSRRSGRWRTARIVRLRGPEDAEVAAHGLAADDERRPLAPVVRRIAAERHLGGEIPRDAAGVDVEVRAGRDADLDVARDALHVDAALAHRLDAHVAGDALRGHRAADVPGLDVAGDGLHAQLAADALEADVAAHHLHDGLALDLAVQGEVTRRGLHVERSETTAELHVGRGGRELPAAAVRNAGAHPERRARAEAEVADRDRDAERLLALELDDDPPAVLAHLGQLDELLVALDDDERLLTVDRLDVDVADRHLHLEVDGLRRVEAVLAHRQAAFGSAGACRVGNGITMPRFGFGSGSGVAASRSSTPDGSS